MAALGATLPKKMEQATDIALSLKRIHRRKHGQIYICNREHSPAIEQQHYIRTNAAASSAHGMQWIDRR